MKNLYGTEYIFEKVSDSTRPEQLIYTIVGDLKDWRFIMREGQRQMDYNDLGSVDPLGGPLIEIGTLIEGCPVTRIRANTKILFEVKS